MGGGCSLSWMQWPRLLPPTINCVSATCVHQSWLDALPDNLAAYDVTQLLHSTHPTTAYLCATPLHLQTTLMPACATCAPIAMGPVVPLDKQAACTVHIVDVGYTSGNAYITKLLVKHAQNALLIRCLLASVGWTMGGCLFAFM